MKRHLLALAAILSVTGYATAATYSDNNPADVWLNFLNPSYTGEFDLTSDGFDPSSEIITAAYATFTFFDVPIIGGRESFSVTISDDAFVSSGSFFGFLNLGDSLSASMLLDLNADGKVSYTITRLSGEFWLANALLVGEAGARSVPDTGATVLLAGAALTGIALLRRRRTA